jgi:uncharacterized heparinase superfamily protein
MYHIAVLSAYLTAVDLCVRTDRSLPSEIVDTTRQALAYLQSLEPPDGEIPLLNDAVFGETLSLSEVEQYALSVDGPWETVHEPATRSSLPESGYYWVGSGDDRLLVDGGPVGPPSLPGHSHNDLLAVMLWVDGRRVLADTGTYSYEPGRRRQYARGVRGHNTVQVDDEEPIPLGRRFLMGERTAPETEYVSGNPDAFSGVYTAHSGYTHRRHVSGTGAWWLVWDRVDDAGSKSVRSRVALHPEMEAERAPDGSSFRIVGPNEESIVWLHPLRAGGVTRSEGEYFPRFGVARTRDVLHVRGEPSDGFGYAVTTDRYESVEVETDGSQPASLALGSKTVEVPTV